MAIFVFLAGLAASYNEFLTNKHIAAQAERSSSQTESSGSDEAAPSTVKPSTDAMHNYAVAPTLPRHITIDKLSVFARILPMSVNAKNQLRAPSNVYDAGWYNASAKPGEPGAMLIDGHISSWETKGVFYGINTL
jgi:sortase (surface protein transpeptidase)